MATRACIAIAAAALLVLTGCRRQPPSSESAASLTFAIDERSNAAPSVAAWGKTAAVVWTASTDARSDIYCSVSTDGGATFGPPARVNDLDGDARASGEQAPRVAVGPGNVIHVAWPARHGDRSVIRYSSSSDGGKSFAKAVTVAGEDLHGARGWHAMTLGYDGGVHAVWLDGRHAAPSGGHRGDHAKHKSSGGATKPRSMPDVRQDIFHASWKGDGPRSEHPVAANVCFCCKTAVATSGDRVYVAWRHIYPESVRDIAVARSTDNGATFGDPARLSADDWTIAGCPDDGPSMAADMHGGVHVTWPTLVDGRKAIFYSSLTEAHNWPAFSSRVRLDSGRTEAAHPQIGADEHGKSAVVWDERADGVRRIVLRYVEHGAASDPMFFEGEGVSYPAVAASEHDWILVWVAQVNGRPVIQGRRIVDVRATTP
ncbi:MAG TPA: sialidase family protein [Vicinamibacterales bacterium]|jgi:hypothetical protein